MRQFYEETSIGELRATVTPINLYEGYFHGHVIETYVAHIFTKEPDLRQVDSFGLRSKWVCNIHCPTDVTVIHDGGVVASVINNEATSEDPDVYIVTNDDGEKDVTVPDDGSYQIRVEATNNGTMYITNHFIGKDGQQSWTIDSKSYAITKGQVYEISRETGEPELYEEANNPSPSKNNDWIEIVGWITVIAVVVSITIVIILVLRRRSSRRENMDSSLKNAQGNKNEHFPISLDNMSYSPMPQKEIVLSEDLRADPGDEVIGNSLRPIIVGKEKPRFFESRYVDVTKFITPHFTPDTITDGWENGFLTLRGASVRGGSHRWENIPRQDSFATVFIPDKNWVVVAVADGVSGASQSHIGAHVAVNSAINYFINTKTADIERINWKHVCETTAQNLNQAVKSLKGYGNIQDAADKTENDIAEATLKYLATTFVCAVITESRSGDSLIANVINVGDSGVWLLADGKFNAVVGGKDDNADITSNDVAPLPYIPDNIEPVEISIESGEVLLIGTDGFGEPLGSGNGDLGLLFKNTLKTIPSSVDFVNTLDFMRKYFVDDRTLVAIWPRKDAHDK
jgi:hypothetical protein